MSRGRDARVNIFDMAGHPVFYEVEILCKFISIGCVFGLCFSHEGCHLGVILAWKISSLSLVLASSIICFIDITHLVCDGVGLHC